MPSDDKMMTNQVKRLTRHQARLVTKRIDDVLTYVPGMMAQIRGMQGTNSSDRSARELAALGSHLMTLQRLLDKQVERARMHVDLLDGHPIAEELRLACEDYELLSAKASMLWQTILGPTGQNLVDVAHEGA